MQSPIIIVFIGNVGAGKSSHILAAYTFLKNKGYNVHKTYVKTMFYITTFITTLMGTLPIRNTPLQRALWRLAVAVDLLLNSMLLPLVLWFRTIIIPSIMRAKIVLVEEHLFGSLVDYIHAAFLLNLTPIVSVALKSLLKLSRANTWTGIIYLVCDKKLLPQRWAKRGAPPESSTYLLAQDLIFNILVKKLNDHNLLRINTGVDFYYNSLKISKFILRYLETNERFIHRAL